MEQELTFETLLDLVEGRLGEAQAEEARTLLAQDERARQLLAWLESFHDVSQETVLAEPPAVVRHSLEQQFEERQKEDPQPVPLSV